MNKLSVPEKHRLKIARDTLKMPDILADIMGMTKTEALAIIERHRYNRMSKDAQIWEGILAQWKKDRE